MTPEQVAIIGAIVSALSLAGNLITSWWNGRKTDAETDQIREQIRRSVHDELCKDIEMLQARLNNAEVREVELRHRLEEAEKREDEWKRERKALMKRIADMEAERARLEARVAALEQENERLGGKSRRVADC